MTTEKIDWRELGLCWGSQKDIWFPQPGENSLEAIDICFSCPVQKECLEYSLTGTEYGVWGGYSANSRRTIRRVLLFYPIEWWLERYRNKQDVTKVRQKVLFPKLSDIREFELRGVDGDFSYQCLACYMKYHNREPYPTTAPKNFHVRILDSPRCDWATRCSYLQDQQYQARIRKIRDAVKKKEEYEAMKIRKKEQGYKCQICRKSYGRYLTVKGSTGPRRNHMKHHRGSVVCNWALDCFSLYYKEKGQAERSKTAQGRESLG